MTEDQQAVFDAFEDYKERAATEKADAEYHETAARQHRALEAQYNARAKELATELGLT